MYRSINAPVRNFARLFFSLFGALSGAVIATHSTSVYAEIRPSQENANWIVVDKADLDKELLLRASLSMQAGLPSSWGKQSRIVHLERKNDRIFLMESIAGHTVTRNLPSQLVLAEFPIISEKKSSLTLDFNAGMKQAYLAEGWYGSDTDYHGYNEFLRAWGSDSIRRFVASSKLSGETLAIQQVLQLREDIGQSSLYPTIAMTYYLSPYRPSTGFLPRENKGFEHFGFFETSPYLEEKTGRTTTHITRWNLPPQGRTLTYYISSNTPPEYIEAVREGILYWNKAFGREVLAAEVAPEGVSAPDLHHNLVQWVEWDRAGFAYADALADPRTGETLNAQVYMTSLWAFKTLQEARERLRELDLMALQKKEASTSPHHQHSHLCSMDLDHARKMVTSAVETLSATDPSDAAALRLSQDIVRSTVGHEVGHTLGLRHNFLGTAQLNVDLDKRDAVFEKYVREQAIPSSKVVVTSSIMDYLTFEDDIIAGVQMVTNPKAHKYDELAIRWAYAETDAQQPKFKFGKTPLFGTDSHAAEFADVLRYSTSGDPLLSFDYQMRKQLERSPLRFVNRYLTALGAADPRDRKTVQEVTISADDDIHRFAFMYNKLIQWLDAETPSLIAKRIAKHQVGQEIENFETKVKLQHVQHQIENLGGVEGTFFWPFFAMGLLKQEGAQNPDFSFAKQALASVQQQLQQIDRFRTQDSAQMRLSAKDKKHIIEQAQIYFHSLEQGIVAAAIAVLSHAKVTLEYKATSGRMEADGISQQFQALLMRVAQEILLSTSEEVLTGSHEISTGFQPTLAVQDWKYPRHLRQNALEMLSSERGAAISWSSEGRRQIGQKLREIVEQKLGKSVEKISPEKIEQPLKEWYLEAHEILEEISSSLGCEDLLMASKTKNQKSKTKK